MLRIFTLIALVSSSFACEDAQFYIHIRSGASGLDGQYLHPVNNYTSDGTLLALVETQPPYPFTITGGKLQYEDPDFGTLFASFEADSAEPQQKRVVHFTTDESVALTGWNWVETQDRSYNLYLKDENNFWGCDYAGQPVHEEGWNSNVVLFDAGQDGLEDCGPLVLEEYYTNNTQVVGP